MSLSAITNLLGSSAAPVAGKVELPVSEDEPLESEGLAAEKCELRIEGMTCGACVESIEGMLRTQPGIYSVKVALLAERGVVEYDSNVWNSDKIVNEISDIGFDATVIPPSRSDVVTLRIYGMTCSSCTSTVETQLSAMPGINSVAVSLATETCKVEFDRTLTGPREMVERIEEMGFDAMLSDQEDATQLRSLTRTKEIQEWRSLPLESRFRGARVLHQHDRPPHTWDLHAGSMAYSPRSLLWRHSSSMPHDSCAVLDRTEVLPKRV